MQEEKLIPTKKLLKKSNSKDNEVRLSYLLAYGHYVSSEYDKALTILNKILSRDDFTVPREIENDIHNLLGHINLIKGEFIRSIEHYEKILHSDFNLIDKFETLCYLVEDFSLSGLAPTNAFQDPDFVLLLCPIPFW